MFLIRTAAVALVYSIRKTDTHFQRFLYDLEPFGQVGLGLPGGGPAVRWGGVPKVAPEPSPYMVMRAVWLVVLRLDWVVFQKVAPELLPYILLEPLLCSRGLGGVETSPKMLCPGTSG